MAISKQQSMRPAEIELIDASNQHAQSLETLDKSLTAETTDRKSADTALGTRIDNEVQARTDADTALGTRIDNEVQARTDADTALGTRIDNEVQARTALGTRIDNEVQARTDADTALGTRIDNETQARTSSDANLQGQINRVQFNKVNSVSFFRLPSPDRVEIRIDSDDSSLGFYIFYDGTIKVLDGNQVVRTI